MKSFSSPNDGQSPLRAAKRCIRIPYLWTYFGFPGQPKARCKSPFREDRNPSFSVFAGGTKWYDFATGEHGDAVDFFRKATGLSSKEACRQFIALAGTKPAPTQRTTRPRPRSVESVSKPKPTLPKFRKGTSQELKELAKLRGIGRAGLELASDRGLLCFGTVGGYRAWIVTDSERLNAQARRLDGGLWDHLEGKPKAWTLRGSWAAWPLGIKEAQPLRQSIALALWPESGANRPGYLRPAQG